MWFLPVSARTHVDVKLQRLNGSDMCYERFLYLSTKERTGVVVSTGLLKPLVSSVNNLVSYKTKNKLKHSTLQGEPSLVNEDAEGKAWLVEVRIRVLALEFQVLLSKSRISFNLDQALAVASLAPPYVFLQQPCGMTSRCSHPTPYLTLPLSTVG